MASLSARNHASRSSWKAAARYKQQLLRSAAVADTSTENGIPHSKSSDQAAAPPKCKLPCGAPHSFLDQLSVEPSSENQRERHCCT